MKKKVFVACLAVALIALVVWTIWGNKALVTDTYIIESEKLSSSFNSYRIAQVSDLHNAEIGKNNKRLIEALEKAQPDIIAVTGDLIDSRRTDVEVAVNFMTQAVKIAPCYYINGNHESRIPDDYAVLKEQLSALGVTILENEATVLSKNGETINLIGINDPDFYTEEASVVTDSNIQKLHTDDGYTILLSHRPELFDVYVNNDIDLVLSGHAHGGQFRLPFVGGLFAPHQGAFPEYDSGVYTSDNINMVVSRGIGNSIFPFRFNNRPQLVVIELKAK